MPRRVLASLRLCVLASLRLCVFASVLNAQTVLKVVGRQTKFLLMSDGSLLACCRTPYTELALPPGADSSLVKIPLPRKAVDVADAERIWYAVLDDGSVWAWGDGTSGQFANGKEMKSAVPVQVPGVTNAVEIVATMYSAIVLRSDGTVLAWGKRGEGLIGDGKYPKVFGESGPPALTPVQVPGAVGIKHLSLGGGAVLALTNDGRVLAWGSNSYGMLGRKPWAPLPIDTVGEVTGLRDVVEVSAGMGVATALKKDGTVWVWGSNFQGQFGNGDRDGSVGMNVGWYLDPRPVAGVANAVSIAAGNGRFTLVLLKDGTLRAWGNTDWGQLGVGGGTGFLLRPVVPKLSGVKAIFTSGSNAFALKADGSLWAWGSGGKGEWPFAKNTRLPVAISLK